MEEIILKLIHSSNRDDNILGLSYLSKLENVREFIKIHGRYLNGQDVKRYEPQHEYMGERYVINRKEEIYNYEEAYFKINKDLYLLANKEYAACECYCAYSPSVKVIEL